MGAGALSAGARMTAPLPPQGLPQGAAAPQGLQQGVGQQAGAGQQLETVAPQQPLPRSRRLKRPCLWPVQPQPFPPPHE